jgi:TRAP-type mannitol/chloroaromatic compound transport system permease small subunit
MNKEKQNAQDLKSTGTAFVIFRKIEDAIKVTRMYRDTSNKNDLFVCILFLYFFFYLCFVVFILFLEILTIKTKNTIFRSNMGLSQVMSTLKIWG